MKKKSHLSRLFAYAGKFKYLTVLSWILSAVSALIALLPFVYIWKLIREVLEVSPDFSATQNLAYNGWMAVLFSVVSFFIYFAALMCSHLGAFHIAAGIRIRLLEHIVKLPMGFMDEFGSGKMRKIINECSAATETYLAHQLPDKAGAIATPFGMLVLLFVFDWRLGLLSLIPVVFAFTVMMAMTGKRMVEKMKQYQNSLGSMSNEAVEYVRGIAVVKTFGQTIFSFGKFKNSIDNYRKWVIGYTKDLRTPMIFYTTAVNSVFVFLIAAGLIITKNGVTNTFLLNLIFYIIFTPIISVTLTKIMFSSENAMIVEDALQRIDSVLELSPFCKTTNLAYPKDNSVEVRDVTFRYKEAKQDALSHISLKIKSGQTVAFVGPSGGGKTTLASIIARFWYVDKGEVLVGGANVKDIEKTELMNHISFVFQDSKLMKTSILENVRMGKPEASREEVLAALKAAQCDDILKKFPNGVDTVIGAKGVYLSGGEQQRIAIARVMLKNTPIVILDEATAFADPDNETKVHQAFTALSKGKTVLMIAHRLSTVVHADNIFVLKNGIIEETGSHSELVARNGLYARMWQSYQKSVKWKVSEKVVEQYVENAPA